MNERLIGLLRQMSDDLDPAVLFPALLPEAATFVVSDPYAFALATCLDRGTRAEIIWTIPYDLRERLGSLEPERIYRLSIEELDSVVASLPRKPRYLNDAPRTIEELTRIVVDEFGGDAARMWDGRSAGEVKKTFLRIHGVGPGIANMAVLLIEKAFHVRFSDMDRTQMDIKPDVHTVRVLHRIGIATAATEAAAVTAARIANPTYPGELDGVLWHIGRQWCLAIGPQCPACPVATECEKVGIT
jgi:endonuclease III